MNIGRWAFRTYLVIQLLVIAGSPHPAYALLAQQRAHGDFNGDGYDDLAIGSPGEDGEAGAVTLIYGSASGLSATGNQVWKQGVGGILGEAQAGDHFGRVLAAGDFNHDGYGDLAIGVPGEGTGSIFSYGGLNVIYGSASGLTALGNQFWDQDSPGILGQNEGNENFGSALATGDFNRDGFTDLAIGVPGETTVLLGAFSFLGALSGSVQVIYGSSSGLTATGNQFWNQSRGLQGTAEPYDVFGASLASGDFDGDGFDDLAIGVPGERKGGAQNAGAVNVIYGSSAGLAEARNQMWSQGSDGIAGSPNRNDQFSYELAAGDFNGDGFSDLAVGINGEDISGHEDAGAVAVIFGRSGGLSAVNNQLWSQDTASSTGAAVQDVAEDFDWFGSRLAAGDFNGDGRDDLAIAAMIEDVGGNNGVGVVHVLFGGGTVLSATNNQLWHQDVTGIGGVNEAKDNFGAGLATGDFNGDGRSDVAIGVPGDGGAGAGAVNVLYGTATGPSATNSQYWTQDSGGILGGSEPGDLFGLALTGSTAGAGGPGVSGEWSEIGEKCTQDGAKQKCTIDGTLVAFNPGALPAGESVVRFFLSSDPVFDASDEFVAEEKVGALDSDQAREITLKAKLPRGRDGAGQFVIAIMDADDQVPEVNENNNVVPSGEIQ